MRGSARSEGAVRRGAGSADSDASTRLYALVVFAHGSGSSRFSPRNRAVAQALNDQGIATLLFDLLTVEEEADRAERVRYRVVG